MSKTVERKIEETETMAKSAEHQGQRKQAQIFKNRLPVLNVICMQVNDGKIAPHQIRGAISLANQLSYAEENYAQNEIPLNLE